jgi:hypothetical protein
VSALTYDITVNAGATFNDADVYFEFLDENDVPIDISTFSFIMTIKDNWKSTAVLTLTQDNGGIVVDGAAGRISFNMSTEDTLALLTLKGQDGYYDVLCSHPDLAVVERVLEGNVIVSPGMSRI